MLMNDEFLADAEEAREMLEFIDRAGLTRRQRIVAERLSERKTHEEIAEELGIAVSTVRLHKREGYLRCLAAKIVSGEGEFHHQTLEAMEGPTTGPPKTPLYREVGRKGEGEVARLNAGPLVTVEDLMREDAKRTLIEPK